MPDDYKVDVSLSPATKAQMEAAAELARELTTARDALDRAIGHALRLVGKDPPLPLR
jgi:hypothetical protein